MMGQRRIHVGPGINFDLEDLVMEAVISFHSSFIPKPKKKKQGAGLPDWTDVLFS